MTPIKRVELPGRDIVHAVISDFDVRRILLDLIL